MEDTESLPRMTMSVALAVSQASHLLSRPVTPVPLTQLPQRKPGVERQREAAQASMMYSKSIMEHVRTHERQMQGQLTQTLRKWRGRGSDIEQNGNYTCIFIAEVHYFTCTSHTYAPFLLQVHCWSLWTKSCDTVNLHSASLSVYHGWQRQ